MSFFPKYFPSRRWFAARSFLFDAYNLINEYKNAKFCVPELFYRYGLAKLNIVRGLRSIHLLSADKDSSFEELLLDLKPILSYKQYENLGKLVEYTPKVDYPGGKLFDSDNAIIVNAMDTYRKGIDEWTVILNDLLKLSIEIFYEVYSEENKETITYYSYFTDYSTEEIYDLLIDLNLIDVDYEDFEENYVDEYDYPELIEYGERQQIEEVSDLHFERFWKWKEEDAYRKTNTYFTDP